MKLGDLEAGDDRILELRLVDDDNSAKALLSEALVSLRYVAALDEFHMYSGDKMWPVSGIDREYLQILREVAQDGRPSLCWVIKAPQVEQGSHRLVIQSRHFSDLLPLTEVTEIGFSEAIVSALKSKRCVKSARPEETQEWLMDTFVLQSGDRRFLVASAGGSAVPDVTVGGFKLHGKGYDAKVMRDSESRLVIKSIVVGRSGTDAKYAAVLLEGSISFWDASAAAQYRISAASPLIEQGLQNRQSYLEYWRKYKSIGEEKVIEKARQQGAARFSSMRYESDGIWVFNLVKNSDIAALTQDSDRLQATEDPPTYLTNESTSLDDFMPRRGGGPRKKPFVGRIVPSKQDRNAIRLKPISDEDDSKPPREGYLCPSIAGDLTIISRQTKALERLLRSSCALPQVAALIEGRSVPVAQHKRIRLTDREIVEAFNGDKPTPMQLRAIEIALNTSDIALIQGPPGTGKTKLITALVKLLANQNKSDEVAGQILLTSFQHDAVEHVAAKTNVYGLPAIKVGQRRDRTAYDEHSSEAWIASQEEWLAGRLQEQPPEIEALRKIEALKLSYDLAPMDLEGTLQTLASVYSAGLGWIPPNLRDRLVELTATLKASSGAPDSLELLDPAQERLHSVLERLPKEIAAVSDACIPAVSALHALLQQSPVPGIGSDTLNLLSEVAGMSGGLLMANGEELVRIRQQIEQLLPGRRPITGEFAQHNVDVAALLTDITHSIRSLLRASVHGIPLVLAEFRDNLANDRRGARASILNYTAVLASTCQHTDTSEMMHIKGLVELDSNDQLAFDTVIVDEAARANPLDLIIPITRASRRVILVGDHRQLPQVVEPAIEQKLIERGFYESDLQKDSLFQRLFDNVQRLEREDHIARSVTLDIQWRMHPTLGEFVSRVFYEPHGETFRSLPIRDREYAHGLPEFQDQCAAWRDVPLNFGSEEGKVSRHRTVEAQAVAELACRILESNANLSLGVITFYRGQVNAIMQALADKGVAEEEEGEANRLEVKPDYQTLSDGGERLRVGTVDSFQGREFDVVILSVTRSNQLRVTDDDKGARAKYGFLTLENRLCVAMSRQRKLLIVVGDRAMANGDLAHKHVRGLSEFGRLVDLGNGKT